MKSGDALGRLHAAAIAVIENDEVLDAIRQSAERYLPASGTARAFASRSSTIASMTMGRRRGLSRIGDDEIRLRPRDRVPLEPAFFGEPGELPGNRVLRVSCSARTAVVEQGADAGLRGDLRDAASHDAGADHRQAEIGSGNG